MNVQNFTTNLNQAQDDNFPNFVYYLCYERVQVTLMEEITLSVCLNKTEESTLELFIREHGLAKKLLDNSALFLHLVMYLF